MGVILCWDSIPTLPSMITLGNVTQKREDTKFLGVVKMSNFMFDECTVAKSELVKLFL